MINRVVIVIGGIVAGATLFATAAFTSILGMMLIWQYPFILFAVPVAVFVVGQARKPHRR